MLQQEKPEDFVIGTGNQHSVQEFVDSAFEAAGLDPVNYLKIDEKFMRPSEVDTLTADTAKAKNLLSWTPKVDFKTLVKKMVDHDIDLAVKEKVFLGL
jgi:GDPmannose 4,6-dehydratase